ncbi:TPA: hypothetical protein ACJXXT_000168 [Pseudomonas aeruginosa]
MSTVLKIFYNLILTSLMSLVGGSIFIVSDTFQDALSRAVPTNEIASLQLLDEAMNNGSSFDSVVAAQGKTKAEALEIMRTRYEDLEGKGLSKEEILADLTSSFNHEKANYNCSNELKKYDNLPDLASYEKMNDLLCNNEDDEKFYTAFMNNLKEGLSQLFKS